jgi:Kef-type K+ transport system membrane component KefB
LSIGWKTTLSGLLALGILELFMIVAVAIAGKAGFSYIKSKIYGFLKKYGPPDTVSKTRYNIGLILFLIPIIADWLLSYITNHIPSYEENRYAISIVGDIVLIASLIVLGGDFWDKLRGLFVHKAKIKMETKNLKNSKI